MAVATTERLRRLEPVRAPNEDRAEIAELSHALELLGPQAKDAHYELVAPNGERYRIPRTVVLGLARVAEVLARGDAISIVSVGTVMTTQQAADLLNISRQYLVRLLDDGQIPFDRTGSHRRLKIEDVLTYKQKRDRDRDADLDELARLTDEIGGYDEPTG